VYLPFQRGAYTTTLYVIVDIVIGGGRATPYHHQAGLIFPSLWNVTPESDRCHSVCTLRLEFRRRSKFSPPVFVSTKRRNPVADLAQRKSKMSRTGRPVNIQSKGWGCAQKEISSAATGTPLYYIRPKCPPPSISFRYCTYTYPDNDNLDVLL